MLVLIVQEIGIIRATISVVHSIYCAFAFLALSDSRIVGFLLLVFVNALKYPIHLLLEQELELIDHELIDRASLYKVRNEALNSITFIDNDSLDTEVGHIDVNVELGFTLISALVILVNIVGHVDSLIDLRISQ